LAKNKAIRQALSLAVQPEALIDLLYYGLATPASVPIPSGLLSFVKPPVNIYRRFDLARSRALIRDAGFPDGEGLAAFDYLDYTNGNTGVSPLAEYLQKSWSAANVKVTVHSADWDTYLKKIRSHDAAIWSGVWRAEYPDPEAFFQQFYSRNISSGTNESSFKNDEYDALYEKMAGSPNSAALDPVYRRMTEILMEECPWIWEVQPMHFIVVQPWIRNFLPNAFDAASVRFWKVRVQ
jgi:ABC-type transport system substrate-binding protein